VKSGCLVLVDGWNHYLAAKRCFGTELARKFPVDRLAWHAAAAAGEETLTDVIVLMAVPEPDQQGDTSEAYAWRRKHRKLSNYGVQRAKNVRFSYHELTCAGGDHPLPRTLKCPECGTLNHMAGRRTEKGADVKLATLAVNRAWTMEYSSLVIFSQDTDFGPLISQLKEVHLAQGRRYNLYSAYPDCDVAGHPHRGVPGARSLALAGHTYAELAAQPSRHVHPVAPLAT
jgi:uncharacterized LabA/DUF88 family protein